MRTLLFLFMLALAGRMTAQSTAYVLQIGPLLGTQRWDNSLQRQILFAWHAALSVESVNNDDDKSSLFAQLGYHVKGSSNRYQFFNTQGSFRFQTENFKFNNICLLIGAKQKFELGPSGRMRYFYFGGIRGNYTVSTNLKQLKEENPLLVQYGIYPFEGGVRKWSGGISVGGGVQFNFADLVGGQVQVSLNPDVTNQYYQGQIPNVIDPFGSGQTFTLPERRIRNTTLEISLGLRLLRKVEYVE